MDTQSPALRNQPRQQRSIETVARIVETAESVFAEVGFDRATVSEVAERAEVSTGSMYRFFPDKNALARAVADRYEAVITEVFNSVSEVLVDTSQLPEVIKLLIDGAVALQEVHPGYYALATAADPSDTTAPTYPVRRAQIDWFIAVFAKLELKASIEEVTAFAEICLDTTRMLIHRLPTDPEARQRQLVEIQLMMEAYVTTRVETFTQSQDS